MGIRGGVGVCTLRGFPELLLSRQRTAGVLACRITHPFHEVMVTSALRPVRDDRFHFELFFSFDKVRRRLRKVGSMGLGLAIRSEKGSMEDGVNTPLVQEL